LSPFDNEPHTPWRDLRHDAPWLPTTTPYFVNSADLARLRADLIDAGFEIVEIDGHGVRTELDLLKALARAMHFPSYFGNNWNAFRESVGREFASGRSGPAALVWKSSDVMLASDVHAFVRSVGILFGALRDLGPSMHFQMELFLVGATSAYPGAKQAAVPKDPI